MWLTFVLIGAGVLVVALIGVGGIQLARRGSGERHRHQRRHARSVHIGMTYAHLVVQ